VVGNCSAVATRRPTSGFERFVHRAPSLRDGDSVEVQLHELRRNSQGPQLRELGGDNGVSDLKRARVKRGDGSVQDSSSLIRLRLGV
jgi:hypothetical protein